DYISEQKSINKLSNLLKEMNERNDEQEIIFSYEKYNQLSFLTKEENHFLLNHIHSKNTYEVYTKIALCYLEKGLHYEYKNFIRQSGTFFEKEYFYQFQIISSEIFKLSPKYIFNFYNSISSKINSNDEIKSIIDKYFLLILKLPYETDLGNDLIFFINFTSMNKNVQDGIYEFLISGDFCNEKRVIIHEIFNIEKNLKKSFSFTEAQIEKIKSICHNSNDYFMSNDLDIIDSYTS
ncbi:TPA: hypothetical protein ACX6QP_003943, partial [Photobacterium damselae]